MTTHTFPALDTNNDFTGTETHAGLESFAGGISPNGVNILTLPAATDTLVGKATVDTLTNKSLVSPSTTGTDSGAETLVNKTLTAPVISTISNTGILTLPTSTDTLVGKTTTDILSNKTIDTAAPNTIKINGNTLSATAGSATVTIPNSTDTLVGKATTDVLTNKTLTSPVINGTPTGTGIPTITLKKGNGAGNYTHSGDTSYIDVDTTNLSYTVTIPTGWKLDIACALDAFVGTAATDISIGLLDGSIINERVISPTNVTTSYPTALVWVITGDGNSHTIKLQYKTSNASDAVGIRNSSATIIPTMRFLLTPSN